MLRIRSALAIAVLSPAVASAQAPSAPRQEAGTINLAPLAGLWKQHRAWAIGIVGVGTLLVASMMFRRGGGAIAMPHPIPRPVRVHANAPMARPRLRVACGVESEMRPLCASVSLWLNSRKEDFANG